MDNNLPIHNRNPGQRGPADPAETVPRGYKLPWPLHPASPLWPEMPPADLRNLADDITEHGLHDPIALDSLTAFCSTGKIALWPVSWPASIRRP